MHLLKTIGKGIRSFGRGIAKTGAVTLELIHGFGEAIKVGALIKGIASIFD